MREKLHNGYEHTGTSAFGPRSMGERQPRLQGVRPVPDERPRGFFGRHSIDFDVKPKLLILPSEEPNIEALDVATKIFEAPAEESCVEALGGFVDAAVTFGEVAIDGGTFLITGARILSKVASEEPKRTDEKKPKS